MPLCFLTGGKGTHFDGQSKGVYTSHGHKLVIFLINSAKCQWCEKVPEITSYWVKCGHSI
ncbi:hypothetical protein B5F78_04550 [Bacteroides sp. An279]|nr:hypothetical protein B5F78_04550 [Bacteroides sp. An279]